MSSTSGNKNITITKRNAQSVFDGMSLDRDLPQDTKNVIKYAMLKSDPLVMPHHFNKIIAKEVVGRHCEEKPPVGIFSPLIETSIKAGRLYRNGDQQARSCLTTEASEIYPMCQRLPEELVSTLVGEDHYDALIKHSKELAEDRSKGPNKRKAK
ncbi:hypothetical protein BD324DRAFT_651544 [Kockovaella imperatae]|uniref:Uncharacterized protein n=1 Tax=Kockovaella imperatae TaxID=4999 RepID=A0A1Y1UFL6_9TREE|nr:hypothetical protein BD324DRAFT_651544 [Kockovaella imperatae]ORX36304.1 hypothetical protein BD324DRAFT_651544 [Kockovaella imperatae]